MHAKASRIVSTVRDDEGKLIDIDIEETGAEEKLNRLLHAGCTTIITNSPLLNNQVKDDPTGRGLYVNIINFLIPPFSTMRLRLELKNQITAIKYENFDSADSFLADRNSKSTQCSDFGAPLDVSFLYDTLLTSLPPTLFSSIIAEFEDLAASKVRLEMLEYRVLQLARLLAKDSTPTTVAVRATAKAGEDNQIEKMIKAIHQLSAKGNGGGRGGGRGGRGGGRKGVYISKEDYTPEIQKELNGKLKANYDEIRKIKEQFCKEKNFEVAESSGETSGQGGSGGKGSQTPPNVKMAHRAFVRPPNDNHNSPLTVFSTAATLNKFPSVTFVTPPAVDYC